MTTLANQTLTYAEFMLWLGEHFDLDRGLADFHMHHCTVNEIPRTVEYVVHQTADGELTHFFGIKLLHDVAIEYCSFDRPPASKPGVFRWLFVFWKVLHGECPDCPAMLLYRGWSQDRPFCKWCGWNRFK